MDVPIDLVFVFVLGVRARPVSAFRRRLDYIYSLYIAIVSEMSEAS